MSQFQSLTVDPLALQMAKDYIADADAVMALGMPAWVAQNMPLWQGMGHDAAWIALRVQMVQSIQQLLAQITRLGLATKEADRITVLARFFSTEPTMLEGYRQARQRQQESQI